jgi:glycosyltransferase involved in cell wall biosynthesis
MGHFVTVLTYEPSSPLKNKTESKFIIESDSMIKDGFLEISDTLKKKEYQIDTIPVIAFKHIQHKLGFQIFDKNLEKYLVDIIENFDIIHFTHPMWFSSALNICKKLGKPTVLTLTDNWLLCPRGLVTSNNQICDGPEEGKKCMTACHYDEKVITRYDEADLFFKNVDHVVSGSNFIRRTFSENNWNRSIELIPFSVDYSHVESVKDPEDIVFGFMGTFIWHKGVHVLIKAFKMVENKKIKLKIFGRGDERDPYVKELINLAKNDDRIEFCGTFDYSELPKIMGGISVIVIPSSYKENFPLVMQNSLAYHKPVIASNVGGMPEVIKDDVNGFLFEQENEEHLARIIHKISQNPEILKRLKNGIKLPPRIEGEALHYENIYRNLLKKKTIPLI